MDKQFRMPKSKELLQLINSVTYGRLNDHLQCRADLPSLHLGLPRARASAERIFSVLDSMRSQSKIRVCVLFVLRADDRRQLVEFTRRGTHRVLWDFGAGEYCGEQG